LGIQLSLFIIFWVYYLIAKDTIHPNWAIALTPLLIVLLGGLALGFGMIISALTTKYRDLIFLLTFGVQLLMYATPVIYPLSSIAPNYKWLIQANPMSAIIETFRYGFLGSGSLNWLGLGYSFIFTIILLITGTIVFNKVEKSFMDTV
ncbi:MAG TPA: ABC transporter permease, partial [Chitinophagaceae bacterium]|nr:ABC transporter permease [Chitinophagaceae bacterium]